MAEPRDAINKVIRRFRELNPEGTRTAVALSGGADSVALLFCLSLLKTDLVAIHIIHDMRSREQSLADCEIARKAAQMCGVDFLTNDFSRFKDNGHFNEPNAEARARCLRYMAIISRAEHCHSQSVAGQNFIRSDMSGWLGPINTKFFYVATAHHADDQLETILMNLCRGCGLDGSAGIMSKGPVPYSFGKGVLIRPMLGITKVEAEEICKQNNLPFAVDQTNFDTDKTRNKIRAEVLPVLKELYPQCSQHATNFADISASAVETIDQVIMTSLITDYSRLSPGNNQIGRLDALRLLPDVVIYHWLAYALNQGLNGCGRLEYGKLNKQMLDDVVRAIRKRSAKKFIWGRHCVEITSDHVEVKRASNADKTEHVSSVSESMC